MSSIVKAGLQSSRPTPPVTMPPIRYAAAAAAAVASPTNVPASTSQPPVVPSSHPPPATPSIPPSVSSVSQTTSLDQQSRVSSSPSLTHPSITSPMLSSAASVSNAPDGSFYSGMESPALSEAPASVGPSVVASSPQRETRKGVLNYFCEGPFRQASCTCRIAFTSTSTINNNSAKCCGMSTASMRIMGKD